MAMNSGAICPVCGCRKTYGDAYGLGICVDCDASYRRLVSRAGSKTITLIAWAARRGRAFERERCRRKET